MCLNKRLGADDRVKGSAQFRKFCNEEVLIENRRLGLSQKSSSRSHLAILKKIRLFATDVDGVLTDGGMYYGETGEEMKKFQTRDGMGIKLLQSLGVITAIITMENTKLVAHRGEKLGIPEIHQGVRDKLRVVKQLIKKYRIMMSEVAFIGDDVNDMEALKAVGFSATPADGMFPVQKIVRYVCQAKGGEGAVRELADMILAAQADG